MNKVRKYYWYVGLPIVALLAGTIVFFDAIVGTVEGNPHPQINYLIFVLLTFGVVMVWLHVMRINRDARFIQEFYDAARADADAQALRSMVESKKSDANAIFEIVTDLLGKPVSSVQHAAVEGELSRFKAEQSRYLILPQFMGGMMVGLGLLGTFIGLLGALAEISNLINAFSITNTGDAVGAIKMLVERLTAPMQAMGVAFSASLFGVLGSLIMGVLLVGLRNASGELNSMLESRVTYLTDFSGDAASGSDTSALSEAVSSLAEQSPVLRGLATALDQSERRVRELVQGMVQLTARIEHSERNMNLLLESMQKGTEREEAVLLTLRDTQTALGTVANRWASATQMEGQIVTLLQDQQTHTAQFFNTVNQTYSAQQSLSTRLVETVAQMQTEQNTSVQQIAALNSNLTELTEGMRVGLQDVAGVQRRGGDHLVEVMQGGFGDVAGVQRRELGQMFTLLQSGLKDLSGIQRRESDQMLTLLQTGLRDLAGAQRRAVEDMSRDQAALLTSLTETVSAGQTEQSTLAPAIDRVNEALSAMTSQHQQGIQNLLDTQQRTLDRMSRDQVSSYGQLATVLEQATSGQAATVTGMNTAMQQIARELKDVGIAHTQLVNRLELTFEEMGARQSQFAETMLRAIDAKVSS
jgi:hypothetical protein